MFTFDIQSVQRFVGEMAWWNDSGKVWFTIDRAILRENELAFEGVSRLGGISMKLKHFKGRHWYGECIIFHNRELSVEAFGLPNDKLWVLLIQPRKEPMNEIWIATLDRVDSFPDKPIINE